MVPFYLFVALILQFILRQHASASGRRIVTFVFPVATVLLSVVGTGLLQAKGEGPPGGPEAAGQYRRYCQSCHGANGAGRRGADDLPNFTRRAWQEKRDDTELLVSILEGKGTSMPAFQDRLSEDQARSLVAHIRAFAPAPPTATARSSPSDQVPGNGFGFAGQFRLLQNEFEDLQRQVQELDSTPQRQSKPAPRAGARRTGPGEDGPRGKRTGMESGTHNRASSTVAGHRGASAEDQQKPQEPVELAVRVHALFSAKCGSCHGADLRQPKGKFGYVLDLERVRGNPKLVVPFRPDESKLWALIRDDKMPPEGDPVGPMSTEEKGLVHDWIAAGAPAILTHSYAGDNDPPARAVHSPPSAVAPRFLHHHLLSWLGRFHIPAIHFPIALVLTAAAGELWRLLRGIRDPWPPVRFCILLGTVGSALAAALGWFHADFGGNGAGQPALLGLHRWLGIVGSCFAAAAAVATEIDFRRGRRSPFSSLLLFASALLIGAAGHFGGSLIHGADFFAW